MQASSTAAAPRRGNRGPGHGRSLTATRNRNTRPGTTSFPRSRLNAEPRACACAPITLTPPGATSTSRSSPIAACHAATAALTLRAASQGTGALLTGCTARLDLRAGNWQLDGLHQALPAPAHAEAEEKAGKISAYLTAEAARRDGGALEPQTIGDISRDRRSRPGAWRRAYRPGPPGWPMLQAWERDTGDGERYLLAEPRLDGRWHWGIFPYGRPGAAVPLLGGKAGNGQQAMLAADEAAAGPRPYPEAQ